ncbi:MAG: response regulator [Nitrospirae bacterium]|nr:MAG: response regulator [Nitrospirota bacterium]
MQKEKRMPSKAGSEKPVQEKDRTILVADDEEDLRMILQMTLEDPRYRILEAADGTTALILAQTECPDLVILDWMMPGMSGLEVVKALRRHPKTQQIPVILLTARDHDQERAEGKAAGVCAYLVKPFSPLELLEKVWEVFSADENELG